MCIAMLSPGVSYSNTISQNIVAQKRDLIKEYNNVHDACEKKIYSVLEWPKLFFNNEWYIDSNQT